MTVEDFITRWATSGAAERANYQLFVSDLCDLIKVERPRPPSADNAPQLLHLRSQPERPGQRWLERQELH